MTTAHDYEAALDAMRKGVFVSQDSETIIFALQLAAKMQKENLVLCHERIGGGEHDGATSYIWFERYKDDKQR